MSASLIVDLDPATVHLPSINVVNAFPCSGAVIGDIVDMKEANTFTNVYYVHSITQSGLLRLAIQTSDATTSGSFTDPTSGLARFPTNIQSGGLIWINSGTTTLKSGDIGFAAFQRPHRYMRINALSGDFFQAVLGAGAIGQRRTTISGPGFTWSPQSGNQVINV